MAKTRSQTGNITIKKEEEEEDSKDNLLLNGVPTATRNKITKRKPSKRNNRHLPAQQVKVEEEDTVVKSLLQSTPKSLKLPKGQPISQEQINQLISAIVSDKMSMAKAARKIKISLSTGFKYYNLYKKDPEKKIPAPRNRLTYSARYATQEQIENLIGYINDDKMTIMEASAKANMNYQSGHYYYNKYLKDPAHNIPIPRLCQYYTQDQKNKFIGYIVNDKMNIKEASLKAKMNIDTGRDYYHKYFYVENPDIPTPSHIASPKRLTQEQIKEVIGYIINGKMSINAASRKVNIDPTTAGKYYQRYLKDNNIELPVSKYRNHYTQDKINELIGYIVKDKMSIRAASKRANIRYDTVRKYYKEYREEHNIDPPALKYRQDKIKEIAGYIIDEKMSVNAAAKKANVSRSTGQRYYRKYLMDKKLDASS